MTFGDAISCTGQLCCPAHDICVLGVDAAIDRIINKFTGGTLRLSDGINAIAKLKRRAASHLFRIDTIHNDLTGPGLLSSRQRILVGDITQWHIPR